MNKKELMDKLKVLGIKEKDKRNSVVCALIGHSKIQTACFGYFYCGRCSDQVGDTLASSYPDAKNVVIVGHNCKTCRNNYKALTWEDKLYAPKPFAKA